MSVSVLDKDSDYFAALAEVAAMVRGHMSINDQHSLAEAYICEVDLGERGCYLVSSSRYVTRCWFGNTSS